MLFLSKTVWGYLQKGAWSNLPTLGTSNIPESQGQRFEWVYKLVKTIDANNRRFRIMMAIDEFLVWKWIVRFDAFLLRDWQARGRNWEIRVGWIPIQRQTCRIDHLFNDGIRESILKRWVQVVSLVGPTGVKETVFGPISVAMWIRTCVRYMLT